MENTAPKITIQPSAVVITITPSDLSYAVPLPHRYFVVSDFLAIPPPTSTATLDQQLGRQASALNFATCTKSDSSALAFATRSIQSGSLLAARGPELGVSRRRLASMKQLRAANKPHKACTRITEIKLSRWSLILMRALRLYLW